MASTWLGFTEDDINRIRREENNQIGTNQAKSNDHSDATHLNGHTKSGQTSKSNRKARLKKAKSSTSCNTEIAINPDQMLSPPKVTIKSESTSEAKQVKLMKSNGIVQLIVKEDEHTYNVVNNSSESKVSDQPAMPELKPVTNMDPRSQANINNSKDTLSSAEDVATTVNKRDATNASTLETFQARQKLIEEQNKKRRAMLTKAIADRHKKTQAEAQKLAQIQTELQKLDSLVTTDISILRNHIEIASMEFHEAQKRYDKAEKEFVSAKLELFQKLERKGQLTEHLCTIIEQNELRKAQKLAELMMELQMEIEGYPIDIAEPLLSKLCLSNEESFSTLPCSKNSKETNKEDNQPKIQNDDDCSAPSNYTAEKECESENNIEKEAA